MKSLSTFLLVLGSVYILICLLMYFFQERLIFFPERIPLDYDFSPHTSHPFEEIWFERPSGKIHGLLFPHPDHQQTILYFHGNGGAMLDWIQVADRFLSRGYGVLIVDYRGYGKSRGPLDQETLLADAQTAYDYLVTRIGETEISVFGRSLGSGFATYVAAHNHPQRLLLETPYYSIARVAARRFSWLPVRQLIRYPMPTFTWITQVSCPVYLIQGTHDTVIPHENSRDLLSILNTTQAHYVEIPDGSHNDLDTYAAYAQWLDDSLK